MFKCAIQNDNIHALYYTAFHGFLKMPSPLSAHERYLSLKQQRGQCVSVKIMWGMPVLCAAFSRVIDLMWHGMAHI